MPTLDIAISTENNWANVQSILGRPGHAEHVLWVDTPKAAEARWAFHADSLLLANGINDTRTVALTRVEEEDPAAFQKWAMRLAQEEQGKELHLHLNGGLKLHQVVLSEVLGAQASLHYTNQGHHHVRRPGGVWETHPSAMSPRIEALLYCYGYEVQPAKVQTLDIEALAPSYLQKQQAQSPHATEVTLRGRWYAFRKTFLWAQRASGAEGDPLRLGSWLASSEAIEAFMNMRRELRTDLPEAKLRSDWGRFLEQGTWALQNTQAAAGSEPSPFTPAGARFEEQVGKALLIARSWFPVEDFGQNLHIHPIGHPIRRAEVDHAWALTGGRVWIFECKAGVAIRKDLEARIRVLKGCFGSQAEFFLVGPSRDEILQGLKDHGEALRIPVLSLGDDPDDFVGQLRALRPGDQVSR